MAVSAFSRSSGGSFGRHLILLLLASIIGTTTAAVAGLAAPTGTATNDINKWAHLQTSHRPTDAPKVYYGHDLRKRELSIVSYATTPPGSNTCGFFTDDGSPMWCDEGYSCTNIGNMRDCCAGDDCKTSSFSSVCLDHTDPACSTFSPGTTCCGGGDPQSAYCATYIWATSLQPKQLFTLFVCEEKQYAGNYSLWAEEPIFVSDASVTPTSHPPLPAPTSNEGTPAPQSTQSANSGLNIGAIVGGVIGGVALIGLLLLAFYYLRNRSRRQIAEAAGSGGEKPQGGQDGYRPTGNGSPSAYNSPPPPSESYWGAPDGTVSSASPAMTGTSATLTPEHQPLVAGHLLTQQQWQYQQQQPQQQWHGQNPQQLQDQLQQEEADRGMAIGMAMGMNTMKQKSPIEMSNSPTSYEVSTNSLSQELSGISSPPRPNAELPA